jgi:hypothetical protein
LNSAISSEYTKKRTVLLEKEYGQDAALVEWQLHGTVSFS